MSEDDLLSHLLLCIYLCIYLFLAVLGLCCFARIFSGYSEQGLLSSCSAWACYCGGFSCCRVQALEHGGFSRCSMWGQQLQLLGLEHRLDRCGAWAQLLHGSWGLPRSEIKPVSPAVAGEFFTTEPPGKPLPHVLKGCLYEVKLSCPLKSLGQTRSFQPWLSITIS